MNTPTAAFDTIPCLSAFREQCADPRNHVIPVARQVLTDGDTPVGLYHKLAGNRRGTFLLESFHENGCWLRHAIIGVRSTAMLTTVDGCARWLGRPPTTASLSADPLVALRATLKALRTPRDAVTADIPCIAALAGYLGYDLVRRWERVPRLTPDDRRLPELCLLLTTDLAIPDHINGTTLLVTNVIKEDSGAWDMEAAYRTAVTRLDAMAAEVARPDMSLPPMVFGRVPRIEHASNWPGDSYQTAVNQCKAEIRAGEAFQIVLSQRFEAPCPADSLDVYRALRSANPSPYMFLFRFPYMSNGRDRGFDLVGSSPETLVKLTGGHALMNPIAGTRPRGTTSPEDVALETELLADPKERAEHVMLVDLTRNDLNKVCTPGSVKVTEFMAVRRFSHVMHLVSKVVGHLREGYDTLDLLASCFPAGTLSGAPKPRAMGLIEQLEPVRRGIYGGCVGYLDFSGDCDTAIAIRTALLLNGMAHVQAGAGIVADSDPVTEDRECKNKAVVVLRAIAAATAMRSTRTARVSGLSCDRFVPPARAESSWPE